MDKKIVPAFDTHDHVLIHCIIETYPIIKDYVHS